MPHALDDVPSWQTLFASQQPAQSIAQFGSPPPPLVPQSPALHVWLADVQSMQTAPFMPHCVSPVAETHVVPVQHPVQLLALQVGALESTPPPPESTVPESMCVPPESPVWLPESVVEALSGELESGVS
jgi:hypothetical protein